MLLAHQGVSNIIAHSPTPLPTLCIFIPRIWIEVWTGRSARSLETQSVCRPSCAYNPELVYHFSAFFSTKKMALTTSMVWEYWTLIELAYPLSYVLFQ